MKQYIQKIAFIIIVGSIAALIQAYPAQAADSPHISGTLTSQDPLNSTLTLKNTSNQACQVATTTTGTVAITNITQHGTAVTPHPVDVSFPDGLELALQSQLKTLQPGESVSLPLRATKNGDTVALRPVTWAPGAGTLGMLYLVQQAPVTIELNYSIPIDSPSETPLCADVHVNTIEESRSVGQFLLGIGIITGLLIIVFILWLLSRRKKKPITAILALAVISSVIASIHSQPTNAQVVVPAAVQGNWDSCVASLQANSDITQPVLDLINSPSVRIIIEPTTTGWTESSSKWPDGTYHVDWNLHDGHRYFGSGGNEDPCTSMYHELYHIMDLENGTFSREDCAGSGIETKEVMATRAQNALRARLGLDQRSHYGRDPLPAGDCRAVPPPPPCRGNCGRSTGDPHLRTLDGHYYDFQAAGEFTLAKTTTGTLDVQIRQEPWEDYRSVTVNTAVAVKTSQHTIEVNLNNKAIQLLVDGKQQPITTQQLSNGDTITAVTPERIDLATQDGSEINIFRVGKYGLDAWVQPGDQHKGKVEGLLGNFDGNSTNDLRLQGETVGMQPDSPLYPAFANSWRIQNQSSHFTYNSGKTTASYTDKNFPYEQPNRSSLPGYVAAETLCKRQGITDTVALANCALDVAITGRPEFIRTAVRDQSATGTATTQGTNYTLNAPKPRDIAKVTFTAKKDEKIFVDIYSSTFPSTCGTITIRDDKDNDIANGCIINSKGHIDTVTIPASGDYTVQLRATDSEVGEARARLYRVTDQTGTITPNTGPVTAATTTPGMQARFAFTATAGQRFFVTIPKTTLPSQCTPLAVVTPSGKDIANSCLINGKGIIDTFITQEPGEYAITVNPAEATTGSTTLQLTTASLISKRGTIGESTQLRFGKPGDEAEIRFTGTAGQRVFIDMKNSSLPSQCGGISLKKPDGALEYGCLIGTGGSLAERGIVLPASGEYVFYLSPVDNNTGEVTVHIHL